MKREKGSILVTTAVSMVALVALLGLALDIGILYTARTSVQHAADAGALAGAFSFVNYPGGSINNPAYSGGSQALARTVAQNAVAKNKVLGNSLATSDATVTFPASNRIVVAVQKTIPTHFIRVVGWQNVNIKAQAMAEAADTPTGTTCLRPFWITLKTLRGGTCGGAVPQPGTTLQLWDKFLASQWGLVGQSSSTIRDQIKSCSTVLNSCGDVLPDKPGASVGGVLSAMEDLICPPGGNCDPCPGDACLNCADWSWGGPGQYKRNGSSVTDNSTPAVITVAIWDDCGGPPPGPGRQNFPIAGYAQIFIESIGNSSGKGINARFIRMDSCPGNGGGGVGAGPEALPIRLINN